MANDKQIEAAAKVLCEIIMYRWRAKEDREFCMSTAAEILAAADAAQTIPAPPTSTTKS